MSNTATISQGREIVDTHGDKTQNNNLRIGILSHISGVCGGHPIAEVIYQADKLMYENKRMS